MGNYDDLGDFALGLAAIAERLNRIEGALGITEPTPAQAEFEARILSDDEGDR